MQKRIVGFLYILICCLFSGPASAQTDLEQGAKLYVAKDYSRARPYFEKVLKDSPNNWQAHYYLANTLLATGEKSKAIKEYEACQKTCTDQSTNLRCLEGIRQASMIPPPKPAPTPKPKATTGTASNIPSETVSPLLDEKRRASILRVAQEEVARIKREAKEQIEQEKAASETSEGHTSPFTEGREQEIERDAEAKCRKVMKDAELRMRR